MKKRTEKILNQIKQAEKEHPAWWKETGEPIFLYPVEKFIEILDDYVILTPAEEELEELEKIESGNSYNWNANIDHDFNWTVYKVEDETYICEIMFHLYGDVRANYTDYLYIDIEDEKNFIDWLIDYDYIDDILTETQSYNIERYQISADVNILSEIISYITVYDMKEEISYLLDDESFEIQPRELLNEFLKLSDEEKEACRQD